MCVACCKSIMVKSGSWVAMHSAGVAVMDAQLRVTGAVRPLPLARVEAMVQALDGTIWLGSDSRLYQFSRRHRQLGVLPHGGGLTRLLLAASDGALWVATQDGVFRLLPGATEVVRIRVQGSQLLHADVNALAEAPDGSVWVGSNVGIFRVAAGDSELAPVASPAGAEIGNPNVVGLLFDHQQTLWVDTSVTGLHRMRHWDGQRASFEHIFKHVNDEFGHAAGDAVIRQMRPRLLRVFRDSDYLVRWGGEEFLVVARATVRMHAPELAERARAAIADQPFELDDGSLLSKTCSIGFCCFPLSPHHASTLDWNAMVKIADEALYAIKNAGRNGWLGALSARSESAKALIASSRQPLDDWTRSGDLQVVCSPDRSPTSAP